MPIMIAFDPPNINQDPKAQTVELGPYCVAELREDFLLVFDGGQIIRLASRDTDGSWAVDGLEGMTFPAVRFLSLPEEREQEFNTLLEPNKGV